MDHIISSFNLLKLPGGEDGLRALGVSMLRLLRDIELNCEHQ